MFIGNVASIMLSLILRHPKYDKIDDEFLCLIEVRLQCIKHTVSLYYTNLELIRLDNFGKIIMNNVSYPK